MNGTITKTNITNENKIRRDEWLRHQHIISLPVRSISLTNPIHINAKVDFTRQIERVRSSGATMLNTPIVVKWEGYGEYTLITGLKGYRIAQALNHDMIPCVVVDCDRKEYMEEVGYKKKYGWLSVDRIIVPKLFLEKKVGWQKVQKCVDYYNEHGMMDKPVSIQGKRLCIDGYSRLIAAKKLGLKRIFVEFV